MVLITAVGIIPPTIINLTSTNSLKRFQVCDKKTNKQKSKLLGQRIFFSVFETLLKLMYFLCDLVQPNLN